MSFLHEPGDLSRTPLAAILLEALNLRATGPLEVAHGDGTSRLWLRDGRAVGAQVVAGVKPLGHMLLQSGRIDIEVLSRSLAIMAETGRPQGDILVEMGVVTRAEVDQVLIEQQTGYFEAIARLESGAFRFDPTVPVPDWARDLLSPLRTIVDALERPQAGPLVISALQPVSAGPVRLASGYAEVARAFRWSDAERRLIARLEAPTSLEAFFAASDDIPPERARAMLAALLLLGLAAPADASRSVAQAPAGLDLGDAAAPPSGAVTPPPSAGPPGRRSDPAEARARRQRLLQQAMKNMGIGPFAGPARPASATPAPAAAGAPAGSPRASSGGAPGSPEATLRAALAAVLPRAREASLFARLGVPETAGREEVKAAYLALAKQYHPDRFAMPALQDVAEQVKDLFTALNEAYDVLSDDRRRAEYLARRQVASAGQSEAARLDFQKGEACLRTRDWARARGFFEAALRADKRAEYQAALALAIVNDPAATRERDRARALAEEAAKDPACDRGLYVAGILARDGKDDARAEKLFRAAVAASPRNVEAVRELRLLERRKK